MQAIKSIFTLRNSFGSRSRFFPAGASSAGVFLAIGAFLIALGFLAMPESVRGLERFTTTSGLIRNSPYVAHVRVLSSSTGRVPFRGVREYTVQTISRLKGRLPSTFRVRIMHLSRIADPRGRSVQPGAEWVLILGKKNSLNLYPLRSLYWGKIDVVVDRRTGRRMLARPLTNMRGQGGSRYFTLNQFKNLARGLARLR